MDQENQHHHRHHPASPRNLLTTVAAAAVLEDNPEKKAHENGHLGLTKIPLPLPPPPLPQSRSHKLSSPRSAAHAVIVRQIDDNEIENILDHADDIIIHSQMDTLVPHPDTSNKTTINYDSRTYNPHHPLNQLAYGAREWLRVRVNARSPCCCICVTLLIILIIVGFVIGFLVARG